MIADVNPILISAKVTLSATIIVTITGTLTAWMMHRYRFPGQNLVETIIDIPLVLPPTAIGFGLLFFFGKNAVFTWWAAVTAAVVASMPLMYRRARGALAGVEKSLEQAARTMGATEWRVFFTVTLPLARSGFLAGVLLTFTRALGEFGAIFFAFKSGDLRTEGYLAVIISLASFIITFGLNTWFVGQDPVYRLQRGGNYAGSSYQKNLTRF